ncbi:MAG TPA: thioredoxin-like domain-containing protein [Pirellulales bacterium]|nr:thioredoxin-like domain-containing protein [Pirellulales bacterium]
MPTLRSVGFSPRPLWAAPTLRSVGFSPRPLWATPTLRGYLGILLLLGAGCARPDATTAQAAEPGDQDDAREATPPGEAQATPQNPFSRRIKAPELAGGVAWINAAGPLELADLKGKFVVLDFWTFCCINCMHILPELKKLEAAYPNEVVVIGVHSAKFAGEKNSKNITEAVLRYEIQHPVVNDANHAIWDRYGIESWPTVLLIDPEGYAVWMRNGEVQFELLDRVLKVAVPYYKKKGLLDETPLRFDLEAYQAERTPLRFPGKVLADEAGGRLFIADSNHNRIVVARLDGRLLDTIGSGAIGAADGGYATASFNKPQGMVLRGKTLYVADTENHLLRKIDLERKRVVRIAGQGHQSRMGWPGIDEREADDGAARAPRPTRFVGPPKETALNSPWDLCIHDDTLYIAMAGPHQIWKMPLDESEIGPYAGNGREDIVDGPLLPPEPYQGGFSSFAQPSGLSSDGQWLYVADSEGSSIRAVPFDPEGEVRTVIGTAHLPAGRLFHFGDKDGKGGKVLLQHALGVAYYKDRLYVADTYNNKIKVIDPREKTCKTIAGTGKPGSDDKPAAFDEPAGITAAGGKLYVADTNNHLIRVIDLENGNRVSTLELAGLEPPVPPEEPRPSELKGAKPITVPPATVKSDHGKLKLAVAIDLPEGYKLNPLAPLRYRVEAAGDVGPLDRAALGKPVTLEKPATSFMIELPLNAIAGRAQLRVWLSYYYCQEGTEGLCKAGGVVWTVPVTLADDAGEPAVRLDLQVEPKP